MKVEKQKELFFPYYVNQGRLLDIYAILNDGYSEYAEISTAVCEERSKSGRAELNGTGGFKLFNFGASAATQFDKKVPIKMNTRRKKFKQLLQY